MKVCQYVTGIYHINYGVIEGFLALRKAVKAHLKKYRIFYLCLISPISCRHVTRISRQSVRLMKERRSLHRLADSDVQTFTRKGRKPRYGEKKQKNTYSVALVVEFSRGSERKSTTGRFATGRFWPCIRQFCILKIMPMVCFCSVPTHFSC